jgi:type IV fimbrial biogenesis protein FimT
MRASGQLGFTLVEILIGVAIVGLMLMVGIPSFTLWIQNQKARTAAEGLLNGMQIARTEAIRRNECMQITLSEQTAWTISRCASSDIPVQSRQASEGTLDVTSTVLPADAHTVSFSGLGRVSSPNPSDHSAPMTSIEFSTPTSRRMRIVVPVGGGVRMCDPQVTSTSDPRYCPA